MRQFIRTAVPVAILLSACPAAAYDPEARRFDELVLRMEARKAEEEAQAAQTRPAEEQRSWFGAWKQAWLQKHDIGIATGPEMAFGRTTFSARSASPVPRGCTQTSSDRMSCAVTTTSGRSGRLSLTWDDRIIRRHLLYTNAGFLGALHSHYTVTEPQEDAVAASPDTADPRYRSFAAGVSGVAYARVGLTPLRAPDVLLTYYLGPALVLGTTESPVGTIDYATVSAYTGIEVATMAAQIDGASIGLFASADERRPVAVTVLSGPNVTRLRPSQVTVSAGCRIMISL